MKDDSSDAPIVIAQNGPLKGERWSIARPVVMGRDAGCEIAIPDRQVSRFHARLTPNAQGLILEDLGSKNGTYNNGDLLSSPVVLQDGDLFRVAMAQEFMYVSSDATMPLESLPVKLGRLMLDDRSRQVWINQHQMSPSLSALQFHLLSILYNHEGQVVSRADLVAAAWGDDQSVGVSDQALDALIRRLRDRLAEMDSTHEYIVTVRGHGIRLDNPTS